jgi:curli biogenesis system outer membrane secretion channel CsgG
MKKVSMLLLLSLIVVLLAACGGEQAQPTATAEPAAPPAVEEAALTMMFDPVLTTVVDLCGEQALAVNAVEDTLAPEIRAQLDHVLVRLVQAAPRPGPSASMLIIRPPGTVR